MIQSLVRKDAVDDLVSGYGHVIVDECHHLPAVSFERVLSQVRARYVVGLTATPQRRDGHHPITDMQLASCGCSRSASPPTAPSATPMARHRSASLRLPRNEPSSTTRRRSSTSSMTYDRPRAWPAEPPRPGTQGASRPGEGAVLQDRVASVTKGLCGVAGRGGQAVRRAPRPAPSAAPPWRPCRAGCDRTRRPQAPPLPPPCRGERRSRASRFSSSATLDPTFTPASSFSNLAFSPRPPWP
jgi:Type III restriction enzyme, res subunit